MPLLNPCRTLWYRLLHHKVPNRALLNTLIPSYFPSSLCLLCTAQEDTLLHFLYDCECKFRVWDNVWRLYFGGSIATSTVISDALFRLKFPEDTAQLLTVHPSIIIAHTLLAIWRAHWSFIFDAKPFSVSSIIRSIAKLMQSSEAELLIIVNSPHRPPPFVSLN